MSEFSGQMLPGTGFEYDTALAMLGAEELGQVLPALEATADALTVEVEMSNQVDDYTVPGTVDHMIVRETNVAYEPVDLSVVPHLLAMKGLRRARAHVAEHHELTQIAPVGCAVEVEEMLVTHTITIEDTAGVDSTADGLPREVTTLHSVPAMVHFDPATGQDTRIEMYEGYQPTPAQLAADIANQGERKFWLAAIFSAVQHQAAA